MMDPIARLEAALRRLGAEHWPPRGWQARVLAATASRASRLLRWLAVPVLALAIAVVIVRPAPPPPSLQLALRIESSGPAVRGTAPHLGDRVVARVTGPEPYRAIWVYVDERALIAACPGAGCTTSDQALAVRVPLHAVGRYTIVALGSVHPVLSPTGSLDADLAAAIAAGASHRSAELIVR